MCCIHVYYVCSKNAFHAVTCMHMHYHSCTRTHSHACMHGHTCLYVYTPILQVWLLQLGRETLAIFPRSAAGVRVVFIKTFQEFQRSEIVVKIDVVILPFRSEVRVFITLAPRPCMLSGVILLPCVDLKPREVAIGAVCGNPHLDPTLGGFQWHVLF